MSKTYLCLILDVLVVRTLVIFLSIPTCRSLLHQELMSDGGGISACNNGNNAAAIGLLARNRLQYY
jgi:hypothetical protein